jgi:hypothetical protein
MASAAGQGGKFPESGAAGQQPMRRTRFVAEGFGVVPSPSLQNANRKTKH